MLKTKVGSSINPDNKLAGKEAAKKARLAGAKVGFLFTSVVMDQKKVLAGIKEVADVPVLGCTSSAAIATHEGYFNAETGYAGIMSFSGDFEVGVAGRAKKEGEDARAIGRELAKKAVKQLNGAKPSYFFMTASPAEEEAYAKGVMDVPGTIPLFGGSAADNTVEGKWSIFCGNKIFADGCAIAVFAKDESMTNLYTGEFEETEDCGIITKVIGDRCLAEIDGVPAVKKYCKWTGKKQADVMGGDLLAATIFDPLGVKDPIGSVTAIRHPMFANDDLSMNIGANLKEHTAICHMHLTPQGMIDANPAAIKKLEALMPKKPQGLFLVHCGGRRLGLQLQGVEDQIWPAVKAVTGNTEFLMVFTFGEYGSADHSGNTVGGLSLSYTGFAK